MSGEVFSGDLPPSFAPGYLADEIANPRPLYIFSLKTLCREGARLRGRELELDDEPVSPVIDTLVTLGFAGAEVWVVSDRETGEMVNGTAFEGCEIAFEWFHTVAGAGSQDVMGSCRRQRG